MEWEIREQINNSDRKMDYIQYRIVRKDGTVRWVDDCGHLEDAQSDKDGSVFYVFLTDVTDTITEAQKEKVLRLNRAYNE